MAYQRGEGGLSLSGREPAPGRHEQTQCSPGSLTANVDRIIARSQMMPLLEGTPPQGVLIGEPISMAGLVQASADTRRRFAAVADRQVEGTCEDAGLEIFRGMFTRQLQALDRETDIDIVDFAREQALVALMLERPGVRETIVTELQKRGLITPVIPIFYRCDRPLEQYKRLGFDLGEFLQHFSSDDRRQLLLEFGAGNGRCMRDRAPLTRGAYDQTFVSRSVDCQIDTLIAAMLDEKAFAHAGVCLTPAMRKTLAGFLYKLVVILPGRTDEDDIPYDKEVAELLQLNVGSLPEILCEKAKLLPLAHVFPDDIGGLDEQGRVVHRKKFTKPVDEEYLKVEREFAEDPTAFLKVGRGKGDIRTLLGEQLFPAGALIGDFRQIGRLRGKRADVTVGLRSTAYLEGEDFVTFMCKVTELLTEDGLHACDGLRINFGRKYQIEEVGEIQRRTGFPVRVLVGPGIQGGDYRNDRIPRTLILTRCEEKLAWIRANLQPNFAMATADELLGDPAYTASLYRPR